MSTNPFAGLTFQAALFFAGGTVLLLAILAVAPLMFDAWQQTRLRQALLTRVGEETSEEIKRELLRTVRRTGDIRGFTRGLIALLIVVLIALALSVAMLSASPDSPDVRKTIITALTTVLATLAGFYFGSRAAQPPNDDLRTVRDATKKTTDEHGGRTRTGGTPTETVSGPGAPTSRPSSDDA